MLASPRLVALTGPEKGREYPLDQAEVVLGRNRANTIVAAWDDSVGRTHARIVQRSGLFWLEDLASTNGTFLKVGRGKAVALHAGEVRLLLDGAEVQLGEQARFQVLGVVGSNNQAVRDLLFQVEQAVAGLEHLPMDQRQAQAQLVRALEHRLQAVQNEDELVRLIAEALPTLVVEGTKAAVVPSAPTPVAADGLPDWPTNLPDPDEPDRFISVRNIFIRHLRAYLPVSRD